MGEELITVTIDTWVVVGLSALLLEGLYETLGISGDLGLLVLLSLIAVIWEHAGELHALIIPALERRRAARRDRQGL